jgi:clan AA aspartic protease
MIIGVVNNFREAVIRLVVSGPAGQRQEIEAVIDTGFTGSLSIPSTLISLLNLPFRRRGRALLADGSETIFDTYEAGLLWDGQVHRVAVDEADTDPLVGMSLLYNHKLTVEIVVGGKVIIEPLP